MFWALVHIHIIFEEIIILAKEQATVELGIYMLSQDIQSLSNVRCDGITYLLIKIINIS